MKAHKSTIDKYHKINVTIWEDTYFEEREFVDVAHLVKVRHADNNYVAALKALKYVDRKTGLWLKASRPDRAVVQRIYNYMHNPKELPKGKEKLEKKASPTLFQKNVAKAVDKLTDRKGSEREFSTGDIENMVKVAEKHKVPMDIPVFGTSDNINGDVIINGTTYTPKEIPSIVNGKPDIRTVNDLKDVDKILVNKEVWVRETAAEKLPMFGHQAEYENNKILERIANSVWSIEQTLKLR